MATPYFRDEVDVDGVEASTSSPTNVQIQKCSFAMINNYPNGSKSQQQQQQQQTILQQIQSIERRVFPKHESMADDFLKEVKKTNNVLLIALHTPLESSPSSSNPSSSKKATSRSNKKQTTTTATATTPSTSVIGYLLYSNNREDQGGVKILKVAVSEAHRRRGIGELLLREALKNILLVASPTSSTTTVSLQVDPTRVAAVSLYKKLGFCEKELLKDYYQPGRDAHLMIYAPASSSPSSSETHRS